jgi:diguanylate cyclase (GGDEF)-like protein
VSSSAISLHTPGLAATSTVLQAPPSSRSSRSAQAGDRQRPPLSRSTPACRSRRAHRPPQPPLLHETLAREVARAQRYKRSLALVVFDLDDFTAINDRIGHLAGDSVLAEAAERVLDVVRSADVACRVGGDEFAVILPESSLPDADQLYTRLEQALSVRPVAQAGRLHLSAGVAELRPDDDAISFFERADEALYRAKGSGKGTVVAMETPTLRPREAPGTASSS